MIPKSTGMINSQIHTNFVPNNSDLIPGADYTLGNSPVSLRLLYQDRDGLWLLCIRPKQGDHWQPLYVLVGRSLFALLKCRNDKYEMAYAGYSIDDLKLIDSLDMDVWGELFDSLEMDE